MSNLHKCEHCGKEYDKGRSLYKTCSPSCHFARLSVLKCEKSKLKKRRKVEKANLPKNAKRGVPDSTKLEVLERDGYACVICKRKTDLERVPHHAYYGYEANLTPSRNDADQLVTICTYCHHELHFGSGNNYRIRCKEYLINTYGNVNSQGSEIQISA